MLQSCGHSVDINFMLPRLTQVKILSLDSQNGIPKSKFGALSNMQK
jgi:hypothetical protein